MLIESSRNLRVVGQKTLIKGGLKNKSLCAVNVAINKHIVTIYTALTHFSCYVLSGTCIRRLRLFPSIALRIPAAHNFTRD